ncbi:MAG TPA: DegT/DnrJ/EryC1/StrS family aminotransferase [Planctomycetota bacterium]|nr:DegT/DnrJ/EryC1/StrS family aminotransferase [Planctomycetota bacterium]
MAQPFHDLLAGYRLQEQELLAAVKRVLESGHYILGPEGAAFEAEFARYLGVEHVIGVANATEALQLALLALDVRPGDEVVIPALTAAPTAMAVLAVGAVPVLADIEPATFTMDPASLRACLSERTRVVVPVHLYGQCADMDGLSAVLREAAAAGLTRAAGPSGAPPDGPAATLPPAAASAGAAAPLPILEDAAQAHGARFRGRMAGSMGAVAAFSFYPTKNLGTYGDGGALSTRDAALAARLRRLRSYGQVDGYDFSEPGINARLDELHAALLRVRLAVLDRGNELRRRNAQRYRDSVRCARVALPVERATGHHVWHQFVVRCEERDALRAHLAAAGVETLIHYPRALHRMTALAGRARWPAVPAEAERAAAQILSLPIYPELPVEHQDAVIAALNAF